MSLLLQKFGGTSVGSLDKIRAIAAKIKHTKDLGHDLVIVVSAMAGETDKLVAMAQQLAKIPDPREFDVLLATGEQVTIALLAIALKDLGCDAVSYTGNQVKIITDSAFNKARILDVEQQKIRRDLQNGKVVIVAGFQGIDQEGNITTLGRGGSDTTAVALAAALQADECQIYTDVDGVYTADPHVVSNAQRMPQITCAEMLELASLGAKVLQIRAVEIAGRHNVPLRVLSSFVDNSSGTLITYEEPDMEQRIVSGIAYNRDEASITLKGVPNHPGLPAEILELISAAHIEVDIITQNTGQDALTDFSFTVHRRDCMHAVAILEPLVARLNIAEMQVNDKIAKLSVVGVGMRTHPQILSKIFRVLGDLGVSIQLIATSEVKVSLIIDEKYIELGVRSLHDAFNLETVNQEAAEKALNF